MPYALGVDVGSGRVAATLCRRTGNDWEEVEPLRLGADEDTCPATLLLDASGYVLLGSQTEEGALARPETAARDALARVGDAGGVLLGDREWPAEDLVASAIGSVIGRAAADEGEEPAHLGVTHPATWGSHRRQALREALHRQGVDAVVPVPRPAAVAERLTALTRVEVGTTLLVCCVGSHRSVAAPLRRNEQGSFDIACVVDGGPDLAGDRMDDLLVEHVRTRLAGDLDDLDPDLPTHRAGMLRLRADCERAKRTLSTEREATIPITIGDNATMLRVTRSEFERMAGPVLDAVVDTALRASGLVAETPAITVLAGGSAAVPLLARTVSEKVGGRITVEGAPELTAAAGAALVARRAVSGTSPQPPPSERHTTIIPAQAPARAGDAAFPEPAARRSGAGPRPTPPPIEVARLELPDRRLVARVSSALRPGVLSALVVAVIAAGVVLTFVLRGGDSGQPPQRPLLRNRTHPAATSTAAAPAAHTRTSTPGGNGP